VLLWFASLSLPAYQTDYHGFEALLLGPIGLFAGHYSWLANPLLLGSWLTSRSDRTYRAFVLSLCYLFAAILFFFKSTIAAGSAGAFLYSPALGFYVWMASIVLALISALILDVQRLNSNTWDELRFQDRRLGRSANGNPASEKLGLSSQPTKQSLCLRRGVASHFKSVASSSDQFVSRYDCALQ
jgi:hypothetical protein